MESPKTLQSQGPMTWMTGGTPQLVKWCWPAPKKGYLATSKFDGESIKKQPWKNWKHIMRFDVYSCLFMFEHLTLLRKASDSVVYLSSRIKNCQAVKSARPADQFHSVTDYSNKKTRHIKKVNHYHQPLWYDYYYIYICICIYIYVYVLYTYTSYESNLTALCE